MFNKEKFIDEKKDQISKIPNIQKETVTSMLEILPYLEGEELQNAVNDINLFVEPEYTKQILNSKNPILSDISEDIDGVLDIGQLLVGDVSTGRCLINLNDLIQTAIIAEPGKGKTKLLFWIIKEIQRLNEKLENKISVVMLDRKGDGRRAGPDFVVLSLDDLGINLFDAPPNCDPRKWISDVSQLLMAKWGFYYRSRNYFMTIVNNLYETKHRPPSLLEVYETIKERQEDRRISSRKLEVVEVSLDRVENSLQEFGRCFTAKKTFPLWEFLDNGVPLVIEGDISNDSFSLLLGWLLLYIYRYRKSNNIRGNLSEGGTVVVCDEAYLLWEAARDFSDSRRELGADFVSVAPLFIRDFRTAIIAASQRPLSPDFMATTNLKIVGNLGEYEDMKYAANSLGDPKLISVIPKLKIGQFIIKIGDKKPALLQTEDYPLQEVGDAELKERMKPFVDYLQNYYKEEEEEKPQEVKERIKLSRDAKKLLFDIVNYPDSTISVRYNRLGLKGKRAQEIVEETITSKCTEIVEEAIEGTKAAKYLVLTQSSIDWLKTQNVDVSSIQHIGRVGSLHALYQNILQAYLKKLGWTVRHDFAIGDKFVDVFAEKENKVAFEIAVSDAVNAARVATALDSVDEYIFLCRDFVVVNTIRSQIKIQSEKIKYFVANQYLSKLKKDVLDYYNYNTKNNSNSQNKQDSASDKREQKDNRRTQ